MTPIDREEPGPAPVPQASGAATVELAGVTKSYGRGRTPSRHCTG